MEKQYKLLAFITLIKKHRINSMIYSCESKKVLAKELGMSYNTFKKWFEIAVEEGLLIKKGNHHQAINLVHTILHLGLRKKLWKYHNFCYSWNYEKLTFKNVYDRIITSIITNNYEQQAFIIERNNVLFGFNSNSKKKSNYIRAIYKKALKLETSTEQLLQYTKENKINKIVSGKFHVAKLIGLSDSSGLRWLKKLHKRKIIKRKVEIKFIPSVTTFEDYDFHISNMSTGRLLPVVGGFKKFEGSSILIKFETCIKTKSQRQLKKGSKLTPTKN